MPVAIVPKSRLPGLTTIGPVSTARPVIKLVELPPLLMNTAGLVNPPALPGVKLTATVPV